MSYKIIDIYSDESGVFDRDHQTFFVFGGLILLKDRGDKDNLQRQYIAMEKILRQKEAYTDLKEIKASYLSLQDRRKVFSILKPYYKFGAVICLNSLRDSIFYNKKTKQRYQDYAYKISVKNALCQLISKGLICKEDDVILNFFVDEHSTATQGLYELEEGLLQEFKEGAHNYNFTRFFPPLFPNLKSLKIRYLSSDKITLIRASDIIANRLYFEATTGKYTNLMSSTFFIAKLA